MADKCKDCGVDMVTWVPDATSPKATSGKHLRGGITCLARQNAQLRKQLKTARLDALVEAVDCLKKELHAYAHVSSARQDGIRSAIGIVRRIIRKER